MLFCIFCVAVCDSRCSVLLNTSLTVLLQREETRKAILEPQKGRGKKGKKTFFLFLACGYRSIYIPVHPNVWLIISPIKLSKFAQFGNRLLEAVAGPRSFSLHHSRSLWTHLAVDLRRNTDVLAACRWLVDACGQWFPEGLGHQTDKTTVRFSGT